MIELKNISFIKDNKKILDNINLKLDDTKFYALTGPNGSGKSTLAKIIMGLIEPTSGSILYNGEDITNKNITERANMGIAFAFQQPVKFKGITVFDLLKFAMNKDINRMDACKYLAKVGLCAKDYVDREIDNSLSGGELKRIEIASILARNPKVAIFDEPEAGIDLWSFKALNNIFKELEKTNNGVTLVITHQERILDIADEIILLENGKISKIGSKDEMMPLIVTSECCGVVNNE
ncbi:MAG TPA: ATP-binding cassette domain-containing protein [Candidatus Onthocola stercorigallinarum]|nr:ATP-binding cassette domain-containing protein [Candidatus Onthocola stercorigallinarum]